MRLENYLFEAVSDTYTAVGEDQFLEWMKKNVSYMTKDKIEHIMLSNQWIWRGVPVDRNYFIVDPSQFERKSANTYNYYTMIIDNSDLWNKYPKRSHSIICTNKSDYTYYSNIYAVFPKDESKVGICSSPDIWDSFYKTIKTYMTASVDLEIFNRTIIFPLVNSGANYLGAKEMTYENFKKKMKVVDSIRKNSLSKSDFTNRIREQFELSIYNIDIIKKFLDDLYDYRKFGGMKEFLEKIFEPMHNGFGVVTIKNYPLTGMPTREVWTDGESALINNFKLDTLRKLL